MNSLIIKGLISIAIIIGLVAGTQMYLSHRDAKADKAGYERAVAEYKDRELVAVKQARLEEQAAAKTVAKEAENARLQNQALRNALGDSERSGQRLRDELSKARRLRCPAHSPAPAGGGNAAPETERMLADLYRRYDEAADRVEQRLGEAAQRVEQFADQAHLAGTTCQRVYEVK